MDDIKEEIKTKEKYLESDFESKGQKRYFLIALYGDKIIGSIEYGQASDLMIKCTNNAYKGLLEVGTVFVHPDFQRNGVGNLLLKAIYSTLHENGIEEISLDCGYNSAKKFGKRNSVNLITC